MIQAILRALSAHIPGHTFSAGSLSVLHEGRFANAIVYLYQDEHYQLIIKDFSSLQWLIRKTIGRLSVRQEFNAITALQHIPGITPLCFRPGECSIAYSHIAGQTLKDYGAEGNRLSPAFCLELEKIIHRMHEAGQVHLDLRNMGNILIDEQGKPAIIDFQSSLRWQRFPLWLQKFMRYADITGAYKAWERYGTTPLPAHKKQFLTRYNATRKWWVFRGYPIHRMQVRVQTFAAHVMSLNIVQNILEKFW